mmetsp:Transcript_52975/g.121659  ORF Transcript_52975/g.121659 Transcript_52975/m.121659 type:complete len:264 (+) Transcript_52975:572-1363(+)
MGQPIKDTSSEIEADSRVPKVLLTDHPVNAQRLQRGDLTHHALCVSKPDDNGRDAREEALQPDAQQLELLKVVAVARLDEQLVRLEFHITFRLLLAHTIHLCRHKELVLREAQAQNRAELLVGVDGRATWCARRRCASRVSLPERRHLSAVEQVGVAVGIAWRGHPRAARVRHRYSGSAVSTAVAGVRPRAQLLEPIAPVAHALLHLAAALLLRLLARRVPHVQQDASVGVTLNEHLPIILQRKGGEHELIEVVAVGDNACRR